MLFERRPGLVLYVYILQTLFSEQPLKRLKSRITDIVREDEQYRHTKIIKQKAKRPKDKNINKEQG